MPAEPAATSPSSALARWTGRAWVVGPSLVFLALYYSLALHMHREFHGWPGSIGTGGFSPGLARHADVTTSLFLGLNFQVWLFTPAALLVCLLVKRWRGALPYLFLSALVSLTCVLFAFLVGGPQGYLHWWRD